MKKSFFFTACAVVFAVPLIALAAFLRPSDILTSLAYDGKPRDFEGKFYASVGEGTDIVRLFGTVRSQSEGLNFKDMKSSLHMNLTATMSEGDISGTFDLMAYHEALYVRISDVAIRSKNMNARDADFLSSINQYQNRWFVLDIPQEMSSWSWTDALQEEGSDLSSAQVKQILVIAADALFSMEHTRTRTGDTYLLTLTRQWADALTSAINGVGEMSPGIADELSSEEMLPVLATNAEYLSQAVTVRLKVDTTSEGDFRFARIYTTFTAPDDEGNPVNFAIEGTLQHRPQPVYLDLPKQTEPLDGIFGDTLPFLEMPVEQMPDEWSVPSDGWIPSDDEVKPFSNRRPLPLPVPSAVCSPDGRVRGIDLQLLEPCPGGRESRRSLRQRLEQ
ncbi:MAG: hypothetical protein PHX87_05785 [Candidatus Peribacteraceae bacterium]|nr:hypothetical protein [Candidatus Peribacteraceae bacterium]MDD5742902.1 hypothetical protein [Candidatus Peribacteraceae bacterium]